MNHGGSTVERGCSKDPGGEVYRFLCGRATRTASGAGDEGMADGFITRGLRVNPGG